MKTVDELLRLTACRTVTDGYCLYLVLLDESPNLVFCLCPFTLRWVWVDGLVMKEITLSIKTHDLTTCTESRVNSEYTLLTERCGHKKLLKILDEDTYSLLVSKFLA